MHQLRLQSGDPVLVHQHIFHPDLRAILDADHLRAQPVLRGKGAEGSGQDQVGFERFANLLSRIPATDQGEDGIPSQNGKGRRTRIREPDDGLFGDSRSEMFGNFVQGGEGQDGQTRKRPGWREALPQHLGREAVAALVDRLDAGFRLQPRAQRGKALGNTVGRHMHIAP